MSVNCKMRVKYFWENFMAMREELESALRVSVSRVIMAGIA